MKYWEDKYKDFIPIVIHLSKTINILYNMDAKDREIEELKRELAKIKKQQENAKVFVCINSECKNRVCCS